MIGVFDSGVGGMSVLSEIRSLMPDADLAYVADRANAPYGRRTLAEIESLSLEVTEWLVRREANPIVVACNTASAAALDTLRERFPQTSIVGMEPAVKPAAAISERGVVGVFATAVTFQGRLFESVMSSYATDIEVIPVVCPEWVELVESGEMRSENVESAVNERLRPVVEAGADTVVLGCTHFSFLKPLIERSAGPSVTVIDPAPAVAAQTRRVAKSSRGRGSLTLAASGDLDEFEKLAATLTKLDRRSPPLPFPK